MSGDSLVLFLQKKAELQKKPVFRIIQINLCEFLDALQTVGQGTSMYKTHGLSEENCVHAPDRP